jgi:hypothetical protein
VRGGWGQHAEADASRVGPDTDVVVDAPAARKHFSRRRFVCINAFRDVYAVQRAVEAQSGLLGLVRGKIERSKIFAFLSRPRAASAGLHPKRSAFLAAVLVMLKLEIPQLLRSELFQRQPGMKVACWKGGGRPARFGEKT